MAQKKRNTLAHRAKQIWNEELLAAAKRMNLDIDEIQRTAEKVDPRNTAAEIENIIEAFKYAQEHKKETSRRTMAKKIRSRKGAKKRATPKDGPKIHILHPDGTIDSRVWEGRLEDKHPAFVDLGPLMDIPPSEIYHTRVLYNGKKMWLFVDDNGKMRNRYVFLNWKASAIYANMYLYDGGATHFVYNDLNSTPEVAAEAYMKAGLSIIGTAVLWEGDLA